jgi:hypothetical protein
MPPDAFVIMANAPAADIYGPAPEIYATDIKIRWRLKGKNFISRQSTNGAGI